MNFFRSEVNDEDESTKQNGISFTRLGRSTDEPEFMDDIKRGHAFGVVCAC